MNDLRTLLRSSNAAHELRRLNDERELSTAFPLVYKLVFKPVRHKDVFEHSVRVFENALELTANEADDVLRVAALLHDVGKFATRSIGRKRVTFQNHDAVGASIVRKELANYGYSKDEVKLVSTLVRLHMRPHGFKTGWSESAVRRLARDAGSLEQVRRLGVLVSADATTKNEKARERFRRDTQELLKAVDAVVEADALAARRPALNGHEVMELTGLKPGRELGGLMKFLNSEEGLELTKDEATAAVLARSGGRP